MKNGHRQRRFQFAARAALSEEIDLMRDGWLSFPFFGLLVLVIVGCGERDRNLPELVPVGGTVTLDGKPLWGAVLRFIPTGSTRGGGAGARTNEDGEYELISRRGGSGTAIGEYRVTIEKLLMPDGTDLPADSNVSPVLSPARQVLAAGYSSSAETILTATVPEGGTTVDFALTSTP